MFLAQFLIVKLVSQFCYTWLTQYPNYITAYKRDILDYTRMYLAINSGHAHRWPDAIHKRLQADRNVERYTPIKIATVSMWRSRRQTLIEFAAYIVVVQRKGPLALTCKL
jgi:hypothetical protein